MLCHTFLFSNFFEISSESLDYPGLSGGDTVVITGTITDINYQDDYWGYGDYTELELGGVDLDGLTFDGDLTNIYNEGDNIEITFHIADESAYGISVEYIEEVGLIGDHLPSSTIKKV